MIVPPYKRKAHYYETDQMGIIHHSNYIRWFEEARLEYLDKIGISYALMEEEGIIIPVIYVSCEYKQPVHFDDLIDIQCQITSYNGIKMTVNYIISSSKSEKPLTLGESRHCFTDKNGRPLSLKKASPKFHELFAAQIEPQ